LRAVSGEVSTTQKANVAEIHYETGSSCTESEEDAPIVINKPVLKVELKQDRKDVTNYNRLVSIYAVKNILTTRKIYGVLIFFVTNLIFMQPTDSEIEKAKKQSDQQIFYRLLSTIKGEKVAVDRLNEVEKQRSKLPIYAEEQIIVETINNNTVTFFDIAYNS
jgi:HrpA-like RNA helicase